MTIEEVNSEKRELAGKLVELVKHFEEKTGTAITDINIYREIVNQHGDGVVERMSIFKDLELKVELQ